MGQEESANGGNACFALRRPGFDSRYHMVPPQAPMGVNPEHRSVTKKIIMEIIIRQQLDNSTNLPY